MNMLQTHARELEEGWHEGELEVQAKLGVVEALASAARVMRPFFPPQHRLFFRECISCLFVGSVDREGRVWASALPGLPGFVDSPTDTSLHVRTPIPPHDRLISGLSEPGAPVGLLGLQLETRRRNRANGKAVRLIDGGRGGFDFALDVSFGNCPKYIQTRTVEYTEDAAQRIGRACDVVEAEATSSRGCRLTPEMRAYVERTDTFFVASCYLDPSSDRDHDRPTHGVDVSHRGVEPGAVLFRDEDGDGDGDQAAATTLMWPDYVGNFFFNTLGNLVKDPRCGLLFIDFGPSGDVLQLTGRTVIEWDRRDVPGAQRSVAFTVERARLVRGALSMFRTTFLERSPFLPAAKMRPGVDFSTGLSGYPVKIAHKKRETHDTMTLVLSSNLPLTTSQRPGQYGTFLIDVDGETLSRTWTLSSAPRSPAEYDVAITVKRQEGGKASAWLHDASVGDSLRLVNVGGDFHLPTSVVGGGGEKLLFVAGGVGVTPLMSMLRGLLSSAGAGPVDVAFLYSVRSHDDVVFGDELAALASVLPGLTVHLSITRELTTTPAGFASVRQGRWTADAILECVPDVVERTAYVCGPDAFMTHIASVLKDQLNSPAAVHTESFAY